MNGTKYEQRLNQALDAAAKSMDREQKIRAMENHGFARGESIELLRSCKRIPAKNEVAAAHAIDN